MSFSTKMSMWWGSLITGTESLFGKKKKRIITHEYFVSPAPMPEFQRSVASVATVEHMADGYDNEEQYVAHESVVDMNSSVERPNPG
ncbi:unnamed protein product [Phytomonas sp. EM1]|nr:unnamed protein product [Phytomonas sp. EM1]|eukprot:CCW63924.1 unnamed protein product [Phytomonas sp. isolate EM1]